MKYLQIIIAVIVIITFSSCKKTYIFTQADLIGTWTETQPYINSNDPVNSPVYNLPYILSFDSNNLVIETSPYKDTATYTLMTNNNLRLDCSIPEGPSCNGFGSIVYSISGDAENLNIHTFSYIGSAAGQQTAISLNLKKTK